MIASNITSSTTPLIKVSITLFLGLYYPQEETLSYGSPSMLAWIAPPQTQLLHLTGGHRRMNEYMNERQVISPALQNGAWERGWVGERLFVDLFLGIPSFCLPTWWERNEELVTLASAPAQAVCWGNCFISLATLPAPNVGLQFSQIGDGMELGETLQPHLCPCQPRGIHTALKCPHLPFPFWKSRRCSEKGDQPPCWLFRPRSSPVDGPLATGLVTWNGSEEPLSLSPQSAWSS